MKDIDFLPEYFQDERKRRLSLQRQCIFLCIIFLIMILSNALGSRAISQVRAELLLGEKQCNEAQRAGFECGRLKESIVQVKRMRRLIAQLGTNPDVANTLAELSTLISDNIVIENLEINREHNSDSAVKSFDIKVQGRACSVSDVAVLMNAMERASGLSAVNLVYSKNMAVNIDYYSIEFEIRSVLAYQVKPEPLE